MRFFLRGYEQLFVVCDPCLEKNPVLRVFVEPKRIDVMSGVFYRCGFCDSEFQPTRKDLLTALFKGASSACTAPDRWLAQVDFNSLYDIWRVIPEYRDILWAYSTILTKCEAYTGVRRTVEKIHNACEASGIVPEIFFYGLRIPLLSKLRKMEKHQYAYTYNYDEFFRRASADLNRVLSHPKYAILSFHLGINTREDVQNFVGLSLKDALPNGPWFIRRAWHSKQDYLRARGFGPQHVLEEQNEPPTEAFTPASIYHRAPCTGDCFAMPVRR